jgi:Domain of unknown function (DUF4461)
MPSSAAATASAAAKNAAATMNGNNNTNNVMTRAVYLARLRRAFLLRVHPDRFPAFCPPETRQRQASLVKALAERMSHNDFTDWQQTGVQSAHFHHSSTSSHLFHHNQRQERPTGDFKFAIERRRDGTLLQCKLRLDQPVDAILNSMVETLRQSGMAPSSLPQIPPPLPEQQQQQQQQQQPFPYGTNLYNGPGSSSSFNFSSRRGIGIDHRYDVVSNQGRNLHDFLTSLTNRNDSSNMNQKEIAARKASRTDAQAAALQVRRLYQFQAVDATSLGWSSASVAVLLNRLLALHQEHADKFHTSSFYPIRLVFWPDDDLCDDHHTALDVYGGGVLSLNPAATPLQWLEKIQLVTPATIAQVVRLRSNVQDLTSRVQDALGNSVKLIKGFSCSNRDYYDFLSRLCPDDEIHRIDSSDTTVTGALVPEPQLVIVESHQACRGGGSGSGRSITVTKHGAIQVSAGIMMGQQGLHEIRSAIDKLGDTARQRRAIELHDQEQAREWSRRAVWGLGLQRVYRTTNRVSHADFAHCLGRLLAWPQQEQQEEGADDDRIGGSSSSIREGLLRAGLTGNGLGIASTGQFCHLADDGSVVIPHDWR